MRPDSGCGRTAEAGADAKSVFGLYASTAKAEAQGFCERVVGDAARAWGGDAGSGALRTALRNGPMPGPIACRAFPELGRQNQANRKGPTDPTQKTRASKIKPTKQGYRKRALGIRSDIDTDALVSPAPGKAGAPVTRARNQPRPRSQPRAPSLLHPPGQPRIRASHPATRSRHRDSDSATSRGRRSRQSVKSLWDNSPLNRARRSLVEHSSGP